MTETFWDGFAAGGLLGLAVGAAVMFSAIAVAGMVYRYKRPKKPE